MFRSLYLNTNVHNNILFNVFSHATSIDNKSWKDKILEHYIITCMQFVPPLVGTIGYGVCPYCNTFLILYLILCYNKWLILIFAEMRVAGAYSFPIRYMSNCTVSNNHANGFYFIRLRIRFGKGPTSRKKYILFQQIDGNFNFRLLKCI